MSPLFESRDADPERAERAIELGWITRDQYDAAAEAHDGDRSLRLLDLLPLSPDQRSQLENLVPAPGPAHTPPESASLKTLAVEALQSYRRTGTVTPPHEVLDAKKNRANCLDAEERFWKVRELGKGGMGRVFQAWDDALGIYVAVKVIHEGNLDDPALRALFAREARILARLRHPNIPQIYAVSVDGKRPFMAMEFIEGGSLRQGPIPESEAARYIRDAARAVHAAHEADVLHRDLAPQNLLLSRERRVYVTDFGLAKRLDSTDQSLLHQSVIGTPGYAAPEQLRGDTKAVDRRSDVYALGACLYHLLTGSAPFTGPFEKVRHEVDTRNPHPPSASVPEVSRDLDVIVLKCLEKDPGRRYGTALGLAEDLDRFARGDPILARPPSAGERAARSIRLYPARWLLGAVLVLVPLLLLARWWKLPGTVRFVPPPGAQVHVRMTGSGTDRTLAAREAHELPAGAYEIEAVLDPRHKPFRRPILVRRGQTSVVELEFTPILGQLIADAAPADATIAFRPSGSGSETLYGSRIGRLGLLIGDYDVRVSRPFGFEREEKVHLVESREIRRFYWSDSSKVWRKRNPSLQGEAFLLIPKGSRDPVVVATENFDLIFLSARTGEELPGTGRHRVATHTQWRIRQAELSDASGPIILACSTERDGLRVQAFEADGTPYWDSAWRGDRPTPDWLGTSSAELAVVGDLSGDSVREIAVGGRDGKIYIINGRTGTLHSSFPVDGPRRLWLMSIVPDAGTNAKALLYRAAEASDFRDVPKDLYDLPIIGRIALEEKAHGWGPILCRSKESIDLRDYTGDGIPDILCHSKVDWRLIDGETGVVGATHPIPNPDPSGNPTLIPLAMDQGHRIAFLGSNALERPPQPAVFFDRRGASHKGAVLLKAALRDRDGSWLKTPLGYMGWDGERVVFVDPPAGVFLPSAGSAEPWRLSETPIRVLRGDWEGDGKEEYFISTREQGLYAFDLEGRRWATRLDSEVAPFALTPDLDGDGQPEIMIHGHASQIGLVRGPRILWERRSQNPLSGPPVVIPAPGHPERAFVLQMGRWGGKVQLKCLGGATGIELGAWESIGRPTQPPAIVPSMRGGGWAAVVLDHRGGDQKNRLVFLPLPELGSPERSFEIDSTSDSYSTPAMADLNGDGVPDFVLQLYRDGELVAVNGKDGAPLWHAGKASTGGKMTGGLAAPSADPGGFRVARLQADLDGDGVPDIVSPSDEGFVVAFPGLPSDKPPKPLWRFPATGFKRLEGRVSAPVFLDVDGKDPKDVLIMDSKGLLLALEGRSGRELWRYAESTGREGAGRPLAVSGEIGNVLLAPMGESGLIELDRSGKRLGSPIRPRVSATPAVADLDRDGRMELIIGTLDGVLIVLDLEARATLWSVPLNAAPIDAEPVLWDLDGDGILDVLVVDREGALTAVTGKGVLGARAR